MVGESIAMIVMIGFRVVRGFLFIYCGEITLYKRLVALLRSWLQKYSELRADPVTLGVRL